jgi:hypothetical protein
MKPVPVVGAVSVIVVVAAGAWFGYLRFGGSPAVVAKNETALFSSEHDAAYVGSDSIETAPAVGMLKQGEKVAVLWDTYGKDYWACYIRASANQRGWVLCPSLQLSTQG